MPIYTPLLETLPATVPFVGPETQERSRNTLFSARVGANENVFGPSPMVSQAIADAAQDVWKYADPENHDLKHALAEHHRISPENIVIGEGIDGLLGLLVRMLVTENTAVVTSLGAYPTFNYHVTGFGGRLVTVPYEDDKEDCDALLGAVQETQSPLVYLANPDNPMGSWHEASIVESFIDALPSQSLLCLDEAYGEFAPEGTLPAFDVNERRVIRMRTFSKAYGMAGARVAYAIGHKDIIRNFNKVRNHFGVNLIAQRAAIAALADQEWLDVIKDRVARANERIAEIASSNGLIPLPSATNFVTIDCGQGAMFARQLVSELTERDIFVRMPFVEPQSRCIRISSGTDADLKLLEETLPGALLAAEEAVGKTT